MILWKNKNLISLKTMSMKLIKSLHQYVSLAFIYGNEFTRFSYNTNRLVHVNTFLLITSVVQNRSVN